MKSTTVDFFASVLDWMSALRVRLCQGDVPAPGRFRRAKCAFVVVFDLDLNGLSILLARVIKPLM